MLRENSELYHEFYHEMNNKWPDQNSWQSKNRNGITVIHAELLCDSDPGSCYVFRLLVHNYVTSKTRGGR